MRFLIIFVTLEMLLTILFRTYASSSAIDPPIIDKEIMSYPISKIGSSLPVATVRVATSPKFGKYLVDQYGRTLYENVNDALTDVTCYNECENLWPPLIDDGDLIPDEGIAGDLDTTPRKDGRHQVTYNGMPLYYYAGDAQPGQVTGQGRNREWHLATS